ncbi:uncharacterized protein LOC129765582 [Toxorhynchites rutilus septentrionalis]|uniref:uncharacterized protein LOC129765582 n=1 Tax=Toxorhynchites rutilus septentrionalis TaxID=329112 RepID=UPI002479B308|nr:uncharacterized protein LOC129765582 [Toxorhynchites rutilus septentrionalis]
MSPPKGGKKKKKGDDKSAEEFPRLEGHREGPKFMVIKRTDQKDSSFEKVSPIFIHKEIKSACGEPLTTVKLRNGTLLVKTKSIAQANQLLRCKMLFDMTVSVEENVKLNQTKGIITSADLRYATIKEIVEELSSQGVCQVEQMKRKRLGILEPTNSFILTFKSSGVPETVKVGYLVLNVRLFIPRPIRCYQCQYYSHPATYCPNEEVCSNCCEEGHKPNKCTGPTTCRNCKSSHHASWSTECEVFKVEQEVMRIKVNEGVSIREARNLYRARNSSNATYCDVVKGNQGNLSTKESIVATNNAQPQSNSIQSMKSQTSLKDSHKPEKYNSAPVTSNMTPTQITENDLNMPGTSYNSKFILNHIVSLNDDGISSGNQMEIEPQKLTRPRSETSEDDCSKKKIRK